MLAKAYYRYCYLRENPIARLVSCFVQPSAARWNDGEFNTLHDPLQDAHNAVLLSLVPRGLSILELGCGTGTITARLKEIGYSHYTGIDLSEMAIRKCGALRDERTEFVLANAETYTPQRKYDVVILNESIYYFSRPIEAMARYSNCLTVGGMFLLSIFVTKTRNAAVARRLKEVFPVGEQVRISKNGLAWEILKLSSG